MNCCAESVLAELQQASSPRDCRSCQGASQPVTIRTMLLMLKPELFGQVGAGQYRFCAAPDCRVVYFSRERCFTTDDLRMRVGLKERDGLIPLCYCFGFNAEDVRRELEATGQTTIPQRIAALTKEGMCACAERNPSGACCLAEVARAVKRLLQEAK